MCACGHSLTRHRFCGRNCDATGCHDCVCDLRAFEVDQGCLQFHPSDPRFLTVTPADRIEQLRAAGTPAPTHTCDGNRDLTLVR
ncbi:hypothetical protein Xcel_3407 (plasmid) [Xylanimonas cellulosilytica DSM 15894]|uniref:Uncharacterized protein n=1 Tax=Xylanimonas cellulosilytica (strain DSM 15894 / JCM 12276 / CECT 5975 / KCTC 9989 / LMG 20990 / NBRC 107835 / XIL07) TaxID=446471 RepID=D1C0U0_XYLCX|nr:hypothetical protein Xcel_3407 [Xylanimonas cellulosilytica DSM 15894]